VSNRSGSGDGWARSVHGQYADAAFASAYWPWTLLAQPSPLPERLLTAAPEAVVDAALDGWGSARSAFDDATYAAYVDAVSDGDHVHAICEEYRAAATADRAHDQEDRALGRRIVNPVLALWSGSGPLGAWYESDGGPLGLWRRWADDVQGRAMAGGHFFPEEHPDDTAAALAAFFRAPSGR